MNLLDRSFDSSAATSIAMARVVSIGSFEHIVAHAQQMDRAWLALALSPNFGNTIYRAQDQYRQYRGENRQMRLADFKALSFDCYGTLIDWEKGILASLQPLLRKTAHSLSEDAVLETYAETESAQEIETPTMRYTELLRIVYTNLARKWGVETTEDESAAFGDSVVEWPPFADSPESLQYLKKHYKLVILSNVDRESFEGSNQKLGVGFDAIYTAEDIGSYKPDRRNFEYLVSHIETDFGIDKSQILHTAQSLFHDHVPATAMGLATAWIDRRYDKKGWGATKPPPTEARIDFHFHSMADLVEAHRNETGE